MKSVYIVIEWPLAESFKEQKDLFKGENIFENLPTSTATQFQKNDPFKNEEPFKEENFLENPSGLFKDAILKKFKDQDPFKDKSENIFEKLPKIIAIKYQMYDPFEDVDPFKKGSKSKLTRFEEKDPFNTSESTKETKYSYYLL